MRRTAITTEDFPRCWSVSTAPWFSMLIEHGQNGWILFCYFTSVQLTSRVPHVGLLAHCLVGSWERFAEWDHEEFRSRARLRLCFTLENHGLPFGLHSIQLYKGRETGTRGSEEGRGNSTPSLGLHLFCQCPPSMWVPPLQHPSSALHWHSLGAGFEVCGNFLLHKRLAERAGWEMMTPKKPQPSPAGPPTQNPSAELGTYFWPHCLPKVLVQITYHMPHVLPYR